MLGFPQAEAGLFSISFYRLDLPCWILGNVLYSLGGYRRKCDPELLATNALKYGAASSAIVIRLRAVGDSVEVFSIHNLGQGEA